MEVKSKKNEEKETKLYRCIVSRRKLHTFKLQER